MQTDQVEGSESEQQVQPQRFGFEFTGSGGEYFKIWIVNVFLTIVTLYVYSAWAKVRTKRYFYGSTTLDGTSFEYHARPLQILFGRMLSLVLVLGVSYGAAVSVTLSLVLYAIIAVFLPWAVWRSAVFNARMSSYRNVRFDFDGAAAPLYGYFLLFIGPLALAFGFPLLVPMSEALQGIVFAVGMLGMYALWPVMNWLLRSYFANGYRYGTARFSANLTLGRIYGIYVAMIGLGLVAFVVAGLLVALVLFVVAAATGMLQMDDYSTLLEDPAAMALLSIMMLFLYLMMLVALSGAGAFLVARLRNYTMGQTRVGDRVQLESRVPIKRLWMVSVTNMLAIIFTFGLAYPWARVRMARLYADCTAVLSEDTLDGFVGAERVHVTALGEELGDAFDLDLGIGF